MARQEPKNIARVLTTTAIAAASVTVPNKVSIELVSALNQGTGGEEVEKVLVINPR